MATRPVDPSGLAASFERAAAGAGVTVHRGLDDDVLARLVKEHEVERAVVASEADVLAVGERLRALDVDVLGVNLGDEGEADLGVTAASAAIASTGAVAVALAAKASANASANRLASIAAPVQLCLVPTAALVATPADLLRPLTGQPDQSEQLAGRLVVITGPSPSGPSAVHVALLD